VSESNILEVEVTTPSELSLTRLVSSHSKAAAEEMRRAAARAMVCIDVRGIIIFLFLLLSL